jgi:hypothetical protein
MEDNMLQHAVRIDHAPEGKVIPFRRGRAISKEEMSVRFLNGSPNWEHPNGDEFHIWNTLLKVNNFLTDPESREWKIYSLVEWLEINLEGEFCISGVFCDGTISVSFQYQRDMEKAKSEWH